jgi:uncharacterized protein (DUF2345 family)
MTIKAKFKNKPLVALNEVAEQPTNVATNAAPVALNEPEEELIFTARRKITLQCGQSSITLHPNGKIILRGEYILSAAEGTNRMVGGQVEIN